MKEKIDRRTFLRLAALSVAGAVGEACTPKGVEPVESRATPTQKAEEEKPTVIVTATETSTPKPEITATPTPAEIPTLVPQVPSESKFGRGGEYPEDLREWPGVESQEIRLTDWVNYWSRAGIFAPDSDEIHFKYFLDEKKKAALVVLEGVKGVYAGNIITAPLLEPKEKKEGSLPLEFIQEPPTRNGRFKLAPDDPTRPLFIKEDNLYFDFEKGTFIRKNEDGKEEYIDGRGQWIIIPEPTETPEATATPRPTEMPKPTSTPDVEKNPPVLIVGGERLVPQRDEEYDTWVWRNSNGEIERLYDRTTQRVMAFSRGGRLVVLCDSTYDYKIDISQADPSAVEDFLHYWAEKRSEYYQSDDLVKFGEYERVVFIKLPHTEFNKDPLNPQWRLGQYVTGISDNYPTGYSIRPFERFARVNSRDKKELVFIYYSGKRLDSTVVAHKSLAATIYGGFTKAGGTIPNFDYQRTVASGLIEKASRIDAKLVPIQ